MQHSPLDLTAIATGMTVDVVNQGRLMVQASGEITEIIGDGSNTRIKIEAADGYINEWYATDAGLVAYPNGHMNEHNRTYPQGKGPIVRVTREYKGKTYTVSAPAGMARAWTLETMVNMNMVDLPYASDGTPFPKFVPSEPLPAATRFLLG